MAKLNRITEKHPSNDALPSNQTADKALNQKPDERGASMAEGDKLIYQLVENCVEKAKEQFTDNLDFNSETLTNVLYDNIYKLLGDSFNQDEFVQTVADKLLENGSAAKSGGGSDATDKQPAKQETGSGLDGSAYRDLIDMVNDAVGQIQARRIDIFKIFVDVNCIIEEQSKKQNAEQAQLQIELDHQITTLVKKLGGNYEKLDEHIQTRTESNDKLSASITKIDTYCSSKLNDIGMKCVKKIGNMFVRLKGRVKEENENLKKLQN